jgi:hypothetical protein
MDTNSLMSQHNTSLRISNYYKTYQYSIDVNFMRHFFDKLQIA